MSTRWPERCALAALILAGTARAQDADTATLPPLALREATALSTIPERRAPSTWWQKLRHCDDGSDTREGWLRYLRADTEEAPSRVFGSPCGIDWHKPTYILPYTYSRDYESERTEVLFGISAKLYLLSVYEVPLYFGFTQRSYWALYDEERSRPFRETVYNPELFARWTAPTRADAGFSWGLDGGYEHESNGRDIPESRSWDRLFVAPWFERGGTAVQLKLWYRLPEDEMDDEDDASGDDNPDIENFMGYGELNLYRQFDHDRRLHAMLRAHPGTGRGAIQVQHDWRIGDGDLLWQVYAFHGYGESLTDYNNSVTRIGIGFSLAR